MKNQVLIGESSPHDHARHSTSSIMRDVCFAMIPILVFASFYFGPRVLLITGLAVGSAVLFEFLWQKLTKQKVTILDFSAAVTGLLIAFNLPVSAPLYIPVLGSAFAIIVVKQFFGGVGKNFMNPALAARCFLLVSFAPAMTIFQIDGLAVATPLTALGEGNLTLVPSYLSCFLGVIPGSIGETSSALILMGGIYLIIRRVISYRIPLAFIGSVFLLSVLFGGDGLYHILTGGVMLGAFFMATDYATSPMNAAGQWIFGFGCGLITVLIRFFGGYPEGVSFSILLMNLTVPLLDKIALPRVYGTPTLSEKIKTLIEKLKKKRQERQSGSGEAAA